MLLGLQPEQEHPQQRGGVECERARRLGPELRRALTTALTPYEMVKEVRGLGMLSGIEFQAPRKLALRVAFESFRRIHPGMFGQVLVMQLFRKGFLTQVCGNNFMVLKAAPPLVVRDQAIDEFVRATADVVEAMHSSGTFWTEALGMARRIMDI